MTTLDDIQMDAPAHDEETHSSFSARLRQASERARQRRKAQQAAYLLQFRREDGSIDRHALRQALETRSFHGIMSWSAVCRELGLHRANTYRLLES